MNKTSGIQVATNSPAVAAGDSYCAGSSCEQEVSRAVALVSSRWAVPVLEGLHFANGPVRFRALQRRLGAISQKELTRQLSLFSHQSVVSRRDRQSPRGSVEYALTERGLALLRQMDALGQWAKGVGAASGVLRERHADAGEPASWVSALANSRDGRRT